MLDASAKPEPRILINCRPAVPQHFFCFFSSSDFYDDWPACRPQTVFFYDFSDDWPACRPQTVVMARAALYTWSNTDPCPVAAALSLFGHYGNPQTSSHPPLRGVKHFSNSTNCTTTTNTFWKLKWASWARAISSSLILKPTSDIQHRTGKLEPIFLVEDSTGYFWKHSISKHSNQSVFFIFRWIVQYPRCEVDITVRIQFQNVCVCVCACTRVCVCVCVKTMGWICSCCWL